jgi:hypothetical protein
MGGTRRSEIGYNQMFGLIAKRFREDGEHVAHEPLPQRWVDLIHHLDEQERKSLERSQAAAREWLSLAEVELAITHQEEVLCELMRTDEPTAEATALLEELRRKVTRAISGRN